MKLAVEKTVLLSTGPADQTWKVDNDSRDLESTLVGKYLVVEIQVKGRNLVKSREEKIVITAQRYAHTIMGGISVRNGQSSDCAHTVESCAIPAIRYAPEAMVLSNKVINKLDSIQHQVARFVLLLPKSSS